MSAQPIVRPRARGLLLVGALGALIAACGHGGPSGPQSVEGTPSQITAAALGYLNIYRAQCGEAPLTDSPALDTAATQHAGWMVLQGIGFTHFETTDGTSGGPPATANVLFAAVTPAARAAKANGGIDVAPGAAYSEVICNIPGANAIQWMWYTVYHRLPLMRPTTSFFGFGDWDASLDQFPGDGLIQGSGFATCLVATNPALVTVVASSWPATGTTGVLPTFDPSVETPNAFDPGNPAQSPHTPATGRLGPPLHVVLPTSQPWATLSVTLTDPLGGSVPLYVLVGGGALPALTAPVNGSTAVYTDSNLNTGEIIIVPQSPLMPQSNYTATLDAATTGTTPDTVVLGLSAPWTFTTGQ